MVRGRAGARAMTGDGPVRIARMCKPARDCAVKARTQAVNQLKAVLVCAGPALRATLSPLSNPALFRRRAQLASGTGFLSQGEVPDATPITLQFLAQRIEPLAQQVRDLQRRPSGLVRSHAPHLPKWIGIGPDSAVTLLITAGGNPERPGDGTSCAALCDAGPKAQWYGREPVVVGRWSPRANCAPSVALAGQGAAGRPPVDGRLWKGPRPGRERGEQYPGRRTGGCSAWGRRRPQALRAGSRH